MLRASDCKASPTDVIEFELSTTSGVIALVNLQVQIDGLQRQAAAGGLPAVSDQAELIDLVALRGQILGHISDYEWAEERAERLTHDAPTEGSAFVARARTRSIFHRFTDALADLDRAQQLGADPTVVDTERANIFQAIGRYEPALTIYTEAAKHRADFNSLGAFATLHAERGDIDVAEQLFDESRGRYCGVSPFPLALLDFRRGLMWLAQGELHQALIWFSAAVRRLPAYAPAQGHLAEVEAALDKPEAAIARLRPLTTSSDDPDYAASLSRILGEVGRIEEALEWRNRAAARYNELLARHPEAFADHAAEFWLEAGADPQRALRFARMNLEIRQTPRAHKLLTRATLATEDACGIKETCHADIQR
jgi:tetratricopeptide (TPR) repeat protein